MSTKRHYTDESTGAVITAPVDSSKVPYCFYTEYQKIIKNKKFRVEAVRRKVSFSKTESQ